MSDKFIIRTGILLCICSFAGSMLGYTSQIEKKDTPPAENSYYANSTDKTVPKKESVSKPAPKEESVTSSYVVKSQNGQVCIFQLYESGRQTLYSSYDDIAVDLLPKADRQLLEKGIQKNTLSDAIKIIEDYYG